MARRHLLCIVVAVAMVVAWCSVTATTPETTALEAGDGRTLPGEGPLWRVVLSDSEAGVEVWSAPARTGERVVYRYVHSAARTPVESRLRVVGAGAGFVVEEERYLWYGAGLEFRADFGVRPEGEWVVVDVGRPLDRLLLRVAGTVEQSVTVGGHEVLLGELAPFGRRMMLEVRP